MNFRRFIGATFLFGVSSIIYRNKLFKFYTALVIKKEPQSTNDCGSFLVFYMICLVDITFW